jgi:hypothetical protein
MRNVGVNALANEFPSLRKVTRRAGKFEVINIHHEEQLQHRVPKARTPLFDGSEPNT